MTVAILPVGPVILHIQHTDLRFGTRVLKEANSAIRNGIARSVIVLGIRAADLPDEESPFPNVHIHRAVDEPSGRRSGVVASFARLGRRWWRLYRQGRRHSYGLVHCHGVGSLPVAVALAVRGRVPLLYDAHELETQVGQSRAASRLAAMIERWCLPFCDAMLCVSDSIADWYATAYGIARPTVVRNIPDLQVQGAVTGSRVLRDRFGLGPEAVVFLYQGALSPGRRIEQLLRVFAQASPDRHLVLMGYGALEAQVRAAAAAHSNIHFQPAVSPSEVLRYTASADAGVCGGENVCLSYYYSLPNKLFEYLLAGLPLLVPDWPEMRRVVDQHGCGWVVGESDEAWRSRIDGMTRADLAVAADAVARTAAGYSWAHEEAALVECYRRLLAAKPA